MQPHTDAAGPDLQDLIRPFAPEASKYPGERFVQPFNVLTPVLYDNRDAFAVAWLDPDALFATCEEWLAAALVLTIGDSNGTVTQWGMSTPPQWGRWAMTNQAGGGWIDPCDTAVQIDSPGSIAAYQFAADLENVHKVAARAAALDEAWQPSTSCRVVPRWR
jgi:sn-glycerol 3-phosphate transport system substrate-binding protein